ncbi:sorting nexin-12-like isoform X1 [Oncorhynchus nerka]|uniref:sorting nexin-12-like isoform X1 n=1 Tax=Oncorhynchus nerka TaxID=8023 RepID=UPI001131CDB7|nr:sorting nexin-12-like isoform X1 [Oncorhynchus nerka]
MSKYSVIVSIFLFCFDLRRRLPSDVCLPLPDNLYCACVLWIAGKCSQSCDDSKHTKKQRTTGELKETNLPIFKLKDSVVRRRYSDFEWLKNELERDSKIVVPPLPGKALKRQLPFRGDEGIFEDSFIEERRVGLEQFINRLAGHPLAQNERCLHMFLQDESIDRNYIPGKISSPHFLCE